MIDLQNTYSYSSTGPELPYGITKSAMATSPDGNGVILVGGGSESGSLNSILELKADGQGWVGLWTTLATKLQYARHSHIVIPVLMDKEICGFGKWNIVPITTVTVFFFIKLQIQQQQQ